METKSEKRGVLRLIGKRIASITSQDIIVEIEGKAVEPSLPQHVHDHDHHESEHDRIERFIFVDHEVASTFYERHEVMSFYDEESQEIKPMTKIKGSFDKERIANDGVEVAEYVIETDEAMDIYIQHKIKHEYSGDAIYREPVDGKISLTLTSTLIGTTRISAVGDTIYCEGIEIQVEEGMTS